MQTDAIAPLAPTTTYLPLILKGAFSPLENGDFGDGLAGWRRARVQRVSRGFYTSQACELVPR